MTPAFDQRMAADLATLTATRDLLRSIRSVCGKITPVVPKPKRPYIRSIVPLSHAIRQTLTLECRSMTAEEIALALRRKPGTIRKALLCTRRDGDVVICRPAHHARRLRGSVGALYGLRAWQRQAA